MAEVLVDLQSLSGGTLGEIICSLNLLIRQQGDTIQNNLDYILSNFQTDNHFKQLVKIRLIDQYHCYDEMLNALKSDDSFYISHVLQCDWFFKNASFDPNELVNSVFPKFSFSTRTKLLKKYSKFLNNSTLADSFFSEMKNRYGLNAAMALLPACSESFIKQLMETVSIQIPIQILIPIYKLYPSVVINYVKKLLESKKKKKRVIREFKLNAYEKLFRLIASTEPEEFASIVESHKNLLPYMRLGKRATRKLLNSSYESVKNNTKAYSGIMVWRYMTMNLNLDQISDLQLAMFPKSSSDFIKYFSRNSDFMCMITPIKNKRVKQTILANNFQKAYKKPIFDFTNQLTFDLARELPREITEKWVELKLPGTENHYVRGDYTVYLPVDRALPQLKQMLESQSDANIRTHLIKCLFELVTLNDDPTLVGPLCEYVVKRFRNVKPSLMNHIVTSLVHYKRLMEIPEEAWTPIEKLLNIMMITGLADAHSTNFISLFSKRIEYRLQRGFPIQEYLEKLVKCRLPDYEFDLCANTPYEKQCLEWFLDWFPEKRTAELKRFSSLESIFSRIMTWNRKHPNEQIQVPDWMIQHIYNVCSVETKFSYRRANLLSLMKKKDRNLLHKFYNKIYLKYIDPQILMYQLHSEPLTIKTNLSFILNTILGKRLDAYLPFLNHVRLYKFLQIPELMSELCLQTLHKPRDACRIHIKERNAIRILSMMLPINKYIELISKYYPEGSTVEDFSYEGRKLLEIQTEIASSFKTISNPSHIIESLSKFTVGDYLKLVVGSLNRTFLRIAENKILPILCNGLDSPVSVKKHFIRGIFKVAPIESILEMLVDLFEKEENVSIRLILLQNSVRFFLHGPCNETFSVLTAMIEHLETADEDTFDKLLDIGRVPDEFLSQYLLLLWNKATIKSDALITRTRNKIIQLIEPSMFSYLSEEFFDTLIHHVFNQDKNLNEMHTFIVNYLIFSNDKEQQNRRLQKILSSMNKLFEQWDIFNDTTDPVFFSRRILSFFIETLVRICVSNEESNWEGDLMIFSPLELLEKIRSHLLTFIKEEDFIEESILLVMAGFFFHPSSNDSQALNHFAKFIEPIVDKLFSIYGFTIMNNISSIIKSLIIWRYSLTDSDEKCLSLSEIFVNHEMPHYKMIGIHLLGTHIHGHISQYKKLIRSIMQISDPVLKPSISNFLKSLYWATAKGVKGFQNSGFLQILDLNNKVQIFPR